MRSTRKVDRQVQDLALHDMLLLLPSFTVPGSKPPSVGQKAVEAESRGAAPQSGWTNMVTCQKWCMLGGGIPLYLKGTGVPHTIMFHHNSAHLSGRTHVTGRAREQCHRALPAQRLGFTCCVPT
jgi:hypothetical protein